MGTGLRNEHSRSKSGREAHGDVGSMLNRKDTSDGSKKIWKRIRAEEENKSQAGWSWGITREACRVIALAFLTWSLSPPSTLLSSTSTTPGQKATDILPQDRHRACGRAKVALSSVVGHWGFACPNSFLGCGHFHQGLQRRGRETRSCPSLAVPVLWLGGVDASQLVWISC